jgi:hypothetical protein
MAEVLVKAIDHIHPDPDIDRQGAYKAGDVVDVRPDGFVWGNEERLPKFIVVKIPGVDPATIENYRDSWHKKLGWDQIAYSQAQDGYRLEVYCTQVRIGDGANILTQNEVENWLTKWNASIVSIAAGKVRFDIGVFQAMCSPGFLDVTDVNNVIFTKQAGDYSTDGYRIHMDWSARAWTVKQVEQKLQSRGATINSSGIGVTIYTIQRDFVINQFKMAVRQAVEKVYMRKRWHIATEDVQEAINAGGSLTLTPAQAVVRFLDKVSA